MKYTIEGFSQEYALNLCAYEDNKEIRVDTIDLVILRYFVDFYPNTKKVEINGKQYAWLAYNKIVSDLPLLRMDKRAISRRLNKLCKLDILTCQLLENNQTMFGFGNNYEGLISSRAANNLQGLDSKVQPRGVPENTAPCTFEYSNISINNNSINSINEKKIKEINKEISSRSETTRDTDMPVSLTEGEKLTPNPLIKDKQEFIREINKYTQDTKLRELLIDYLISRLEQNPNMSLINFKASLATLTEAACYCEIPDFSMEYQYRVVINATTASYSQFKPIFDKKYKSNQTIQENSNKAPFGDHSRCIPAGTDLELALDDNGNPIKF